MKPELVRDLMRTSEVSRLIGESREVIYYWDKQFEIGSEKKSIGRVFTRAQVAKLWLVKRLLRNEGYTIRGAKQAIERLET